MKNKYVALGLLSAIVLVSLAIPRTSEAFWPFDKWFGNGKVMGETTDTPKRTNAIKSFFGISTPSPTPTKTEKPELDEVLTEERLNALVKGRIISEAQKKQILLRLAVIRTKRLELKKLQDAFKIWMRENKIDPKVLIGENATPSGSPKKPKPTVTIQNVEDDSIEKLVTE